METHFKDLQAQRRPRVIRGDEAAAPRLLYLDRAAAREGFRIKFALALAAAWLLGLATNTLLRALFS